MIRSARLVTAPSLVIEIDEVFEARIASSFTASSSALKSSALTFKSSVTASTTMNASRRAATSVVVFMRPTIVAFSSALSRSLSTSRCKLLSMAFMPRARKSSPMSRSTT
jgi:hypothetical protein